MFNLSEPFFIATVVDRDDPLRQGRCRLRIDNIHPDSSVIADEDLPWSIAPLNWIQSAGSAGIGWSPTGPIEGTRVLGIFLDQDKQLYTILGTLAGGTGHLSYRPPSEDSSESPSEATARPKTTLGEIPSALQEKGAAIARKLMDRYGITATQASGLVGNFVVESGLIPNRIQGKGIQTGPVPVNAASKSGIGYGWAQWDNTRRVDFQEFCSRNNLDIQTDEANWQFLCKELDTTEKRTIREIKSTTTLEDAVVTGATVYERAGTPHMDRRISAAGQILKVLSGVSVPVRAAGAPVDDGVTEAPDDQPFTESTGNEPPREVYRGIYPYNKTFRSESGHLIEIDDTPDNERLLNYHTSGTYEEIINTGRRVVKVIDDNYTIVVKDDNLYVDGNVNIFVNGNLNAKVEGDTAILSGGSIAAKTDGDFKVQAGGSVFLEASGEINLKASGNINADGSQIHLNDGVAKGAGISIAMNPEQLSFLFDEPDEFEYYEEVAGEANIDIPPTPDTVGEPDQEQGDSTLPALTLDCGGIENLSSFPLNLKLSDSFTLGQLTKFAAFGHELVENRGLSKGKIACNLSLLAINCLERIKARFPNVILTSGFRPDDPTKPTTSQHGLGQAVDMQFSGVSNAGYLEIARWIRDESGILFDQLLLEGKNTGTGNAWIHISFSKTRNRAQVLTMFNHKVVGSGLIQKYV